MEVLILNLVFLKERNYKHVKCPCNFICMHAQRQKKLSICNIMGDAIDLQLHCNLHTFALMQSNNYLNYSVIKGVHTYNQILYKFRHPCIIY